MVNFNFIIMNNLEKISDLISKLINSRDSDEISQLKKEIDRIVFSYEAADKIKQYLEWQAVVEYHESSPWEASFPIEQDLKQVYSLVKLLEREP